MLLTRVITALILIPLVLLAVLKLNIVSFEILSGLVFLGCAYEWAELSPFDAIEGWSFILSIVIVDLILMVLPTAPVIFLTCLGWLYAFYCCHRYSRSPESFRFQKWHWLVFGWLALCPSWLTLNTLRFFIGSNSDVIFLFLLIWGADSGAYFAGRFLGKHLLAPQLSPKKTWEGVKGAAAVTLLVVMLHGIYLQLSWYRWLAYVLIYAVTLTFAIYGDLFESLLKRLSNTKDSGKLLPGHGGLLDRLDSLFAATPVFASGLILMKFLP